MPDVELVVVPLRAERAYCEYHALATTSVVLEPTRHSQPRDDPARVKHASARRTVRQPGLRRDHHARGMLRRSWLNTTRPRARFALDPRG